MSSKKPTVLLDMDGIMCDINAVWLPEYNRLAPGEDLNFDKISHAYYVEDYCKNPQIMLDILEQPGFFANLPPIANACEVINQLTQISNVFVITQPPKNPAIAIIEKKQWLEKNTNIHYKNIVYAYNKSIIDGDLFFDDNPEHLVNWQNNHPNGLTATIDYKYNRTVNTNYRWDKDSAWNNLLSVVKGMV